MPIGSAKIGVLGAGLVPGGTQTFNASGTFTVPPGVKKVSITGKGGTGNPGNAGNSGNPGNPGTGGGGGGSGAARQDGNTNQFRCGNRGGGAWKGTDPCGGYITVFGGSPPPSAPYFTVGGNQGNGPCQTAGNPGSSGASGNAGNAGNAGNPGNTGNASSGLSQTFNGGAGGNAGVAGAAGNAGNSGGGGAGSSAGASSGGSGGSGGGNGGSGANFQRTSYPNMTCWRVKGGTGGGGAGVTNDGTSGPSASNFPPAAPCNNYLGAAGGTWSCSSAPLLPAYTPAFPVNTTGGSSIGSNVNGPWPALNTQAGRSINVVSYCIFPFAPPYNCRRPGPFSFNPYGGNPAPGNPTFPQIYRSGGAGGSGYSFPCTPAPFNSWTVSGGGGGGGRGGAGGAGGTSPTPSGSAATPSTVNCLPVTPGGSYPITVASPGGQIVISWNPQ